MSLNSGAARVLFVEDDLKLRGLLEEYFRQQGFETCSVGDGESALERARTQEFDLVVLDVMIPGPDGYEVCREIRTFFDGGILMLTARRGEQEQIVGLDLGADDYVTKPVDPTLLVARMRSLLRRVRRLGPAQEGPIRLGSLELSTDRRALGPRGDVGLTQSELELVRTLASRAGEVVDREVLVRIVRGVDYDGLDRTVDIHISRVRRKLERAGVDDVTIVSVRGVGYVMASNLA